jgi:hypothetical protein
MSLQPTMTSIQPATEAVGTTNTTYRARAKQYQQCAWQSKLGKETKAAPTLRNAFGKRRFAPQKWPEISSIFGKRLVF